MYRRFSPGTTKPPPTPRPIRPLLPGKTRFRSPARVIQSTAASPSKFLCQSTSRCLSGPTASLFTRNPGSRLPNEENRRKKSADLAKSYGKSFIHNEIYVLHKISEFFNLRCSKNDLKRLHFDIIEVSFLTLQECKIFQILRKRM